MNEAFRRGAGAFPDASAKEQPSRSGQRVPFGDLSSDPHRQIMEKWLQMPIFYRNPEFCLPSLVHLPVF